MVSAQLREFVEAGVSILVGSRDARSFPECARAVGVDAGGDEDELTVFVPHATGATTRANVLDNGRVAVCFARIADHHSLQLKGRLLELRDSAPEERALVEAYRGRLSEALAWVGMPPRISLRLSVWPCYALRFRVERTFDQTPGPGAGEALGAAAGGA